MDKQKIIQKIIEKKEFSNLPEKDVEKVFEKFEKRQTTDEDKIKLSRDLLRKIYSSFTSGKLLTLKDKSEDWILKKHLSTRERLDYYDELYSKLFKEYSGKKISVIDLGAGVNGFSYKYFKENNFDVKYVAIEAVGQLVALMNFYFEKNKLNASAVFESLFELEKIKKIIQEQKKPKIVFLFKVLDSLEMIERDYSKKLLNEIVLLVDKIVLSFATESFVKRKKFHADRSWILDFIKENFNLIEEFQLGSEKYVVFKKR